MEAMELCRESADAKADQRKDPVVVDTGMAGTLDPADEKRLIRTIDWQ